MTVRILQIPLPADTIRKAYLQLIADIDTMIETLTNDHFQDVLQCRAGCSECCVPFSVLPLEAVFITESLQVQGIVKGKDVGKCLLLSENLCQVYVLRPVICRTQGLALGYIDETAGSIEVSACRLNFSDDFPFSHDNLLYMDQFNSRLAELNLQFCQEAGLDPEKRIPLADLVIAS